MITLDESTVAALLPQTDPLAIYLNDHLAGATAGVELLRRAASSAEGEHRETMRRLLHEVEGDRAALIDLMGLLEVPVRHYKVAAGWLGEKVARLKPNGRLVGRSPLATLIEAETLLLGVQGKAAGWRALRVVAEHDRRLSTESLDALVARAERQAEDLEALRKDVAAAVFPAP